MREFLGRQAATGWRALAGASAHGTVPISEQVLNEALAAAVAAGGGRSLRRASILLNGNNRAALQLEVWSVVFWTTLRPEVEIEPDLGFPAAPSLRILLPPRYGMLAMLGAAFASLPEGITLTGRQLNVNLRVLLAGSPVASLLPLVQAASVDGRPGELIVRFQLAVA